MVRRRDITVHAARTRPYWPANESPIDPATAFNPFGDGSSTPPDTIAAIAAIFMNENSNDVWSRFVSRFAIKACASLNAMPAPQSDLQGYSHPG